MEYSFSKNIHRVRQQKGIFQDHLSKKATPVLNAIVKIETQEKGKPTIERLKKITKALGVSVSNLFKK